MHEQHAQLIVTDEQHSSKFVQETLRYQRKATFAMYDVRHSWSLKQTKHPLIDVRLKESLRQKPIEGTTHESRPL